MGAESRVEKSGHRCTACPFRSMGLYRWSRLERQIGQSSGPASRIDFALSSPRSAPYCIQVDANFNDMLGTDRIEVDPLDFMASRVLGQGTDTRSGQK